MDIDRIRVVLRSIAVISKAGMVRLSKPREVIKSSHAMRAYGPLAGPAMVGAIKAPNTVGLVDDRGALTFSELDQRSNALARAWLVRGLGQDSVIGLLSRDHRGGVDTMLAAGKLGATLVPLNTGIGAGQLAEIARRENVTHLVYDKEFVDIVAEAVGDTLPSFDDDELEQLVSSTDGRAHAAPDSPGRLIMMTSGTTGTPKGTPRKFANPLSVAQLLDRIPLRAGGCTVIPAPLFHGTGLSQFIMSFALGCTVVVHRRFDPETTLKLVQRHQGTALVLVPTMLHRIVELGDKVRNYDTSSLRIILVAGSPLSPSLAARATELFGDVLHNMYGGTEVSIATVAMPDDNRAAPGSVGRPPVGTRVALFDEEDRRIDQSGVVGRIFVGNDLTFDAYTDGSRKDVIDGMVSTGDLGHFDAGGRLFVDGRADDMIITGGENVHPVEVENALVGHEAVADAAVVGVADETFGQRLKAYVVLTCDAPDDVEAIKGHVRSTLARHKVPREVVIVDAIPRNNSGKLLRRALPDAS